MGQKRFNLEIMHWVKTKENVFNEKNGMNSCSHSSTFYLLQ